MKVTLNKTELENLSNNPFKYNRPTTKSHIKSMLQSVNKWGVLRDPVLAKVAKSGKTYIADGQHLIKAVLSSKNQSKLDCVLVDVENEQELIYLIADLNTSSKSWSDKQFLDSWLNFGSDNLDLQQYEAYYKVHNINETTKLPLGLIIDVLCTNKDLFKQGKAKLKDVMLSNLVIKTLSKLKEMQCPAHQLYGAKAYIEHTYKNNTLNSDLLINRIQYLKRCKDAFVPSNREQFKKYLFGLMNCSEENIKEYIYGKWIINVKA